jgi:hypothetical protein
LSPTYSGCFIHAFLNPPLGIFQIGGDSTTGCSASRIYGPITGPATIGSDSPFDVSENSGDFNGVNQFYGGLVIPNTYSSGESISGTSTSIGHTFASLGLAPGTYDWSWGSTNPDSYQLIISSGTSSSSNVPGPLPIFGAGAAYGWSRRLRKRIASPGMTPPEG